MKGGLTLLSLIHSVLDLVEHMEGPLVRSLVHCPGFLQQVWRRRTVKEQQDLEVADIVLKLPTQPSSVGGVSS